MADLRPQRRLEQLDGDREALEHIARALEGRVLPGPGAVPPPEPEAETAALTLDAGSLKLLLEAMPAAIGMLGRDGLIYANSAFAFAFGYRSPSELLAAGGLDAVLPDGAPLAAENGSGRCAPREAFTRSRRKLKVAFALTSLDEDIRLLRLIDQTSLEQETPPPPPVNGAAALAAKPESDATGRLDFLAKVSHEVRTPLNSIIGFAELMSQERFGPIGNPRYK
jgi:signal transduction histidine kinase